jgi:mono/diheme cytochrome c family protein
MRIFARGYHFTRKLILTLPLFLVGTAVIFASCAKEEKGKEAGQREMGEHAMPSNWRFSLPKGDPLQGRKIFVEMECYKCHEIKGEAFGRVAKGEAGVGPELSQMAGMHPVEFFAESIINPNAVIDAEDKARGYLGEDGRSKMPDYSDLLTVKQVADLASYLASLKAEKHAGH